MYTSKLISVVADQDNPNLSVSTIEFTNGQVTIQDVERGLSKDSLIVYCRQKIAQLSEQDKINDFIASPPLGDIDTKPAQPTADEQAQIDFNNALSKLQGLKQLIDLGIITEDDQEYIDALQDAKDKKV